MSDRVQFSMTKRRLAVFILCVGLGLVVLYSAGVVTGLLVSPVETSKPLPEHRGAVQKAPASVPTPAPKPVTPKAVPLQAQELAVQVASFRDLDRAERFARSLKRQGFVLATVNDLASADQTWHVVRLGPYHDWDTASQVAAEVGRSYNLNCTVHPL